MAVIWDTRLKEAIEIYQKGGLKVSEINKLTGVAETRIYKALTELGTPVPNLGSKPKYNYNTEAFSVIKTENQAYWLGFLFADGSVSKDKSKFSLAISNKDRIHLEKFRDFICPDKKLEEQVKQNSVRVIVCSNKITKDLINLGCVPQKSLILEAPKHVPAPLERHFIRGYFDGDGCARKKNGNNIALSLVGTEDIINFCRQKFIDCGALCTSKVFKAKSYNAYVWENGRSSDLKLIYHYLYDSSTIFLDRKRVILQRSL